MRFKRLVFICLLCFATISCFARQKPGANSGGFIDLRDVSLQEKVALDGKWLFYWEQLISPEGAKTNGELVDFPKSWKMLKRNGIQLPSFGYASYQVKLVLPKTKENFSVAMPDVYCAYKMYLNGELVASNGNVTTTPEGFIAHWQYRTFDIPAGTDTATLVLQIANYVHSKGGIKDSIFIGKKETIELDRRRAEAIDLILTGCLCMGGIFFLGLYLLGNRDQAILLFSLYSIVYSYRIMGVGNYVLHTIFPNADFNTMVRLEYLSLFISVGLFALYTLNLYREDVNKKVIYAFCGICAGFALSTLILPAFYFSQLINPFLLVTVFCIVYTLYIYTIAYQRKRPGSVYALLSSMSLMISFAITLLHYWNIIPHLQIVSFCCYVSFFFLQSLILSHRVSYVLRQAKFEAEQGLKAKSEFLSTMSHEIRTPLNSVIGISHLLLKNDPRPDQIQHLDTMLFSANNLLGIVNDILDYNKIEAGKIELDYIEIDLAMIVNNIIAGLQGYAQEKNVKLDFKIDRPIAHRLLGDPIRIFQVITNLVHNAIKFTQDGNVTVNVSQVVEDSRVLVLKIQVIDTGIGISAAQQQMIFDRFTQADSSTSRSFGGTGLGLAISKKILELQGSSLKVISEEGKGANFYFVQTFKKIAHSDGKAPVSSSFNKEKEKPLLGSNILLVEDNALNVMVAKSFLENWGAAVDVAINGEEALNTLDVTKHQLILMDLQMPVMDGYEASANIRKQGITLPIIALTANTKKDIEQKTKAVGINDVIVKPFLPDDLYQKIMQYLF